MGSRKMEQKTKSGKVGGWDEVYFSDQRSGGNCTCMLKFFEGIFESVFERKNFLISAF
jgi:hypothetical protein